MSQRIFTVVLAWVMLGVASGQQPLTPGVGQYCSNFANGFYRNPEDGAYMSASFDLAVVCNCALMPVCAGQSNAACPWAAGAYCGVVAPCERAGDDYRSCQIEGTIFCNSGCAAVSPCTALPLNAHFTGAANPITSSGACPWECNAGYTRTASSCALTVCTTSFYNNGTDCAPCPTCATGLYRSGCIGTSSGECITCTNTV